MYFTAMLIAILLVFAPTPALADSNAPKAVAVVGDSLEWNPEATSYYVNSLTNAGWAPYIERCWNSDKVWSVCGGQQIPWGVEMMAQMPKPDVWVMALGTNDAAVNDLTDAQWRERIWSVLRIVGKDTPLLWVNVIFMPPQSPQRMAEGDQFNRVLNTVLRNRRNHGWKTRVGYWKKYVVTHQPFPMLDNGLHYSPDGYSLRADWITAQIERWK